ncbi:hypothetical protein EWM64_g571 [Hericium alpestre]|uniref:Major facilitator superfamily (MFS) profile domain-containing protein n=1 Tax=Hericium alpestre TaxID=135208 RepID=A0A4Z0AB18_9AGAM|nr:hypothetical protein EWM64_g571 [Hericium alpestre]
MLLATWREYDESDAKDGLSWPRYFDECSFFYTGLGYSWGVVQARLSQSHNLGSDAALSFVGSTCIAFVSFAALINARLIRWLGTRNSALLACSFLGLGQFLNGWSVKSYKGLFVINGIIMGFGSSMCFMTCGSLPAQYFKRRRGLADGFVFAGTVLVFAVTSIVMNALIDTLRRRISVRAVARFQCVGYGSDRLGIRGSPVAGWLLEAYGGSAAGRVAFRPAIYFAGSLSVASTGLILTMRQLLVKKIFVYA